MKTEEGRDINAMGYGDQNRSFPDGNNSRGVFEQTRPTGVLARGQKRGELRTGLEADRAQSKGRAGGSGRSGGR